MGKIDAIELYSNILSKKLDRILDIYNGYNVDSKIANIPNNTIEKVNKYNEISKCIKSIQNMGGCTLPTSDVIVQLILEDIDREAYSYNNRISDLDRKLEIKIKEVKAKQANKVREKEKEIEDRKGILRTSYSDIIERQKELKCHRNELEEIFNLYNIEKEEAEINISEISRDDLYDLFNTGFYAYKYAVYKPNIIYNLLNLVYYPANHRQLEYHYINIIHLIVLILVVVFTQPYGLGIVGLLYIVASVGNIYGIKKREHMLKIAYALTGDLDLDLLILDDKHLKILNDEYAKLKEFDIDDEIVNFKKEIEGKKKELYNESPEYYKNTFRVDYSAKLNEIDSIRKEAEKELSNRKDKMIQKLENVKARLESELNSIKYDTEFCDYISVSKLLSFSFKFGKLVYNNRVIAESKVEFDLNNIYFIYSNEDERIKQLHLMKLMILNLLSNVKERFISLTVYDALKLGIDFSEFQSSEGEMNWLITVESKNFNAKVKEWQEYVSKLIKRFGSFKDIQAYNKDAIEKGKSTIDYQIVVILSSEVDYSKDEVFKNFLSISYNYGIYFFILDKDTRSEFYAGLSKAKTGDRIILSNTGTQPKIVLLNQKLPLESYVYNTNLTEKLKNKILKYITDKEIIRQRTPAYMYEKYKERHIPRDKVWSYKTDKGIDINLGVVDGDMSNTGNLMLGDYNVHALMVGATGAGKSIALNVIIANLLWKYPPEELELIMVDFKNAEFSMYKGDNLPPHCSILSGTTDGEYAVSVLGYVVKEMKRRNSEVFSNNKVRNIAEYNSAVEKGKIKGSKLPRIMIIFDEFQVMFTEVQTSLLETIKIYIKELSKLARSCGAHMLFASQSMQGTMSKDVLDQFGLRIALRCSKDTSSDILGNDASAHIKEIGWLYTNTTGGVSKDANMLWRIPYITDNYFNSYLKEINQVCKERGGIHRQAVWYDEKEIFKGDLIAKYYSYYEKINEMQGMFLLGERVEFSTNGLPVYCVLGRDDFEHIMCTSVIRKDLCDIANTFIENLRRHKEEKQVIITCCDKGIRKLLGLDEPDYYYHDSVLPIKYTGDEIIENLENLIELKEKDDKLCDIPVYLLAISWDKLYHIGVDESVKLQDRFKAVLKKSGNLNIHIIFILRDTSKFRTYEQLIKHRIIAKQADTVSSVWINSMKAAKLPKSFAIYHTDTKESKFKLYDFKVQGDISDSEIIVERRLML